MLSIKVKVARGDRESKRYSKRRAAVIARAWVKEVDGRLKRGQVYRGRPAYKDHGPISVAPGYADGGRPTKSGARRFPSSAALRAGKGYANTSGGMRKGLVSRGSRGRARVRFKGASLGAQPVWAGGQASGQQIPNLVKAETVLRAHDRNVLDLGPLAMREIRDAETEVARCSVGTALDGFVKWRSKSRPRSAFARRILRG